MTTSGPAARILVVDDDVTARVLMRAALRKAGFEVAVAVGGEDALSQFGSAGCDMVMLDVDMPGMDGHAVCAALRAQAGELLPIVMVTGKDDVASVERAYESGATDFLSKPINWALVGHRVRYLFRAHSAQRELRRANARNAALLNAIPDTLFRIGAAGVVLEARGAAQAPSPALARGLPAPTAQRLADMAQLARASGIDQHVEFSLAAADAADATDTDAHRTRYFEARIATIDAAESLGLVRDITDRKEAEQRIARLAYFDSLTGLPNRAAFIERLGRETLRVQRAGRKLGVLFMDLDGFKQVNDTMGHSVGDTLLLGAAQRLRHALRPSDMVSRAIDGDAGDDDLARLGGDEFTALIPDIAGAADALTVARRIGDAMRRPFLLEGREVMLTVSIGIALYPDDGDDAEALLKHADTAMYHAKGSGRDNCQLYSAALTAKAVQRMELDTCLRAALQRGEFALAYQPQFDVAGGRIRTVEALIRWTHPQRGPIAPLDFIPAAEENGLICAIGRWVLRNACDAAARWARDGHALRVAVNVSPRQFRDPGLLQSVLDALAQSGLPPELLELEVTEGAVMENSTEAIATLKALRSHGVHIALDDFGCGYSSLSYLTRMPITNLKVDRSFIAGLCEGGENAAIVRAILAMAANLGMRVTAEGVETIEQARLLKSMACDVLQGYYFSRPVAADAIAPLLALRWTLDGVESLAA